MRMFRIDQEFLIEHWQVNHLLSVEFLCPLFSLEKKGILISYQSRSVVRLSVRLCVRADVRPWGCVSVTFLVNVSPP